VRIMESVDESLETNGARVAIEPTALESVA